MPDPKSPGQFWSPSNQTDQAPELRTHGQGDDSSFDVRRMTLDADPYELFEKRNNFAPFCQSVTHVFCVWPS